MERKYKPLRPALATERVETDLQAQTNESGSAKRKRVQVKVACDTCRAKKSACDGRRPVCSACVRRGSSCMFGGRPSDNSDSSSSQTPLPGDTNRHNDAIELLNLLISVNPEEEALKLLNEIKSYGDISLALSQIKTTQPPLYDDEGPDFLWPSRQGSVEFELMTRHPILYPSDAPLDWRFDPIRLYTRKRAVDERGPPTSKELDPVSPPKARSEELAESPPLSNIRLGNRRLQNVDFGTWTKVPISNIDAVNAIARYLALDHAILGLFDVDLFLDDICNGGTKFCSEFMVDALLSWACLDASSLNKAPTDLCATFFRQAFVHLTAGQVPDALPSVAGLQLLSLTATYVGQGDRGLHLLRQAISMGLRMKLLGHEATKSAEGPLSESDMRAAGHCAWGLFSYATLHALHNQKCELGTLAPPNLPPPNLPPPNQPPGIANTDPTVMVPDCADATFPYFCRLWEIVHVVIHRYHSSEKSSQPHRFDAGYVQTMLARFLSLGDQLPLSMVRGDKITHDGMVLHMTLHAGIITLLRPLVLHGDDPPLGLETQTNRHAEEISRASANQLRRLVTSYLSSFKSHYPTVLWHTGCLYLANAATRSTHTESVRRTDLYLSLTGYRSMYPTYPVTMTIAKGLLAMALSSGLVTSEDAGEAIRKFRAKENGPNPVEEPTEACFMVDLDLALSDHEGAHIDSLAQKFDDMVMFAEFTHSRVDEEGGVTIS